MKKPKKSAKFVHLRAHSAYSLLEGAIQPKDLVKLCKKNRMPAIAVTDSNNLFGSLEFSVAAAEEGIQPIIGCVLSIMEEGAEAKSAPAQLVLLAKDAEGYQNLLKISSKVYQERQEHNMTALTLGSLKELSAGLIALSGGPDGVLGKKLQENQDKEAEKILKFLLTLFPDRFYMEIMRHNLPKEEATEKKFVDMALAHNIPLVATNDVFFSTPEMFEAHDALTCIAEGRYIVENDRKRLTESHYFKNAEEMEKLFEDMPEAIANTLTIAKRCAVMSEVREPILPHFPTRNNRSEAEELKDLAKEGLLIRLESHVFKEEMSKKEKEELAKPYWERLEYELGVINNMHYSGYFLIVSDFVRWSKSQNIPVGPGRGSGAGSVIAWVLQITDLDPLRFGLLFERFLNPERVSMPDFDIDFCQERRDEVINYVQKKYGEENVAQIITFGKLQARAVLRDVGRVLQMPYGRVDKICKMIPFNPIAPVTLSQAITMDKELQKERDSDEQVAKLLDMGLKLEGLYRHASTHAAGVVIGDRPLNQLVPLYSDPRSETPVTQYSMKHAEMAGLVKFDFLGLKTLTVIAKACDLIEQNGGDIDIELIPLDDKKTFDMLASGETTGVFQMESSGMRDALRKMKPDTIEDIIALISLYRPGPMENIPTYIARKHGREKPDYLHPMLRDILKETFGVIIYQEQVMQIAQVLAGYSLASADLLRRAMGKKIKAEMDAQRDMFVNGAVKNNVDKKQASNIFDLVAKFAGYGFNKSHAAAYAVIGYRTAYLKANFPVEFCTASMNIDIGDTDKINIFRQEAARSAITLLPPEINKSNALFTTEKLDPAPEEGRKRGIRYALGALKNVGLVAMKSLVEERNENGVFKDIFDFTERSESKVINKRQLESMTKAGVFDEIHQNRRQIFESVSMLNRYNNTTAEEKASNQTNLFGGGNSEENTITRPTLPDVEDWDKTERMNYEFEALGFYLSSHPLEAYDGELSGRGILNSANLEEKIGGFDREIKIAGVVTGTTHRSSGNKRFAYAQLSDVFGMVELSIFNEALISDSRDMLESLKPLLISADARKDEGGIRLIAKNICYLDDYLEKNPLDVKIFIADKSAIKPIKETLSQTKSGNAQIFFIVHTRQGMEVEITLPDRYSLRTETIKQLQSTGGVTKI